MRTHYYIGNDLDDKIIVHTFPLRNPYGLTAQSLYTQYASKAQSKQARSMALEPTIRVNPMKDRNYLSFLVRVWRVRSRTPEEKKDTAKNEGAWRASIEHSLNSTPIHFPDLESLFEYIRKLTAQNTNSGDKKE